MRHALLVLALLSLSGCDRETGEVRMYELRYLEPEAALATVRQPENGVPSELRVMISPPSRIIHLEGEPDALDRAVALLRRIDRPRVVRFRFQLVEADGFNRQDSAIADVEAALRDLFRFRGYRLAAEAVAQGEAPGRIRQQIYTADGEPMIITAEVIRVVADEDVAAVSMNVDLATRAGSILSTSLTVPSGQTAVVGSARASSERGTLILVVRPEIQ